MGQIGTERREVEFEPLPKPETAPRRQAVPDPTTPAPALPEPSRT